jgi:hypothetical protein
VYPDYERQPHALASSPSPKTRACCYGITCWPSSPRTKSIVSARAEGERVREAWREARLHLAALSYRPREGPLTNGSRGGERWRENGHDNTPRRKRGDGEACSV